MLTQEQRSYVRLIKQHGALNRAHYRQIHNWIHPVMLRFPERHYVAIGEEMGLSPSPSFAPQVYLHRNPDVAGASGPLRHYLQTGRAMGLRAIEPELYDAPTPAPLIKQSRLAIVAHVHYLEVWPEMVAQLRASRIEADLFITTTGSQASVQRITNELGPSYRNHVITSVPNRGRDAAAFNCLVDSGVLDGYDAVCKIHTKRSPGRNGDAWRRALLNAVLPPEGGELVRSFLADDLALVATAGNWIQSGRESWGTNREAVCDLLGEEVAIDDLAPFPAGSMYWIKPQVLQRIRSLQLNYDSFDLELGQVDGTTAHAFERLIGFLCRRDGGSVVAASTLLAPKLGL